MDLTDHFPIFILTQVPVYTHKPKKRVITNVDHNLLSARIVNLQLHINDASDIHSEYNRLVNTITSCITETIADRKVYFTKPICPWATKEVLVAIRAKEKWFRKYKMFSDNKYYKNQYKTFRNKTLALIRKAKKAYYCNLIERNQRSPKNMWKVINSVIKKSDAKQTLPEVAPPSNTSEDVARNLNEHFCKIGPTLSSQFRSQVTMPSLPQSLLNSFAFEEIDSEEIIRTVNAMSTGKSAGPDNIPLTVLKHHIQELSAHFATIFNASVYAAIYPDDLKTAKVVPIYKGGDVNDYHNYRPISILSAINTIFEKLLAKRIIRFLDKHQVLLESQHGFRANKSTATAVKTLSETVNKALNDKCYVIGIFIDIKKAFDTINHEILLMKMERYGFRGLFKEFLQSYLTGRTQFVKIGSTASSVECITCGVPQGSVLGPILFSLYINDLPLELEHGNAIMYADDTAFLFSGPDLKSLERQANDDLTKVTQWFTKNKLTLNVFKTNYLVFSSPTKTQAYVVNLKMDDILLKQIDEYKYLGVTLDSALNFKQHITNTCNKLTQSCFILIRVRGYFPLHILKMIYYSLFHCHITYCVETWGVTYASYINRVTLLQKRALRIITFSRVNDSSDPLFSGLNIMPLTNARDHRLACMVKNILENNIPLSRSIFQWPHRETRNQTNLRFNLPVVHNNYGKRNIAFSGAVIWNLLPLDIKTNANFSKSVKEFYCDGKYVSPL